MNLCKKMIAGGAIHKAFRAPQMHIFDLPEKVLQFGTGVLLRGLPDYYIDKANKQNIFNGRVVVVKSTGTNVDEFAAQDSLYTHCIKGIHNGIVVDEKIINASIGKVLSASNKWSQVLDYAESAHMQIIISNTTEVGIVLQEDDDIKLLPPLSFPAKLLAFLYRRYQHFNGSVNSGMVIIATELIVDNGSKLKEIVVKLAGINKLEESFIQWLQTANDFCNSLVDRIVPGLLQNDGKKAFEESAGYRDDLVIMSEPYRLWAIQTSSERTKELLSFYKADESVIITPDINKYRELKLRLLNGTHTFSCGLFFLAGFNFVYQSMHSDVMNRFIEKLMVKEIVSCIVCNEIKEDEAIEYAGKVTDRFSNPYIEHKWINITLQYSAKMKLRNVPLLLAWYTNKSEAPMRMAAGFAAYILFMKPVVEKDGIYYGQNGDKEYKIADDKAGYFYRLWQNNTIDSMADKILSDNSLWDVDLTKLNGFAYAVKKLLHRFSNEAITDVISSL